MGRDYEKIAKHIPDILRERLIVVSKVDFSIRRRGYSPYNELFKEIKEFIKAYNHQNHQQLYLSKSNFNRALLAKEDNPEIGFSLATANTFCIYASNGQMDWIDFLNQNPTLKDDYGVPKMDHAKNNPSEQPETTHNADVLDSNLTKYLKRKSKQFELIFLPIAPEETSISVNKIPVPTLACEDRFEDLYSKKYLGNENERVWRYGIKVQEELETIERMIVVAEGGVGKTTLCKWLFHYFAHKVIDNDEPYFPIYIDLKGAGSLQSVLEHEIEDFKFSFLEIQELLKVYIPVFICDGLDEVDDKSAQIINDLIEIGTYFNDYKIIIFSRGCHYVNDFSAKGFSKYDIESSNNERLPGLVIKEEGVLKEFKEYERDAQLPEEIQSNCLLYTSFILHYIRNGKIENHPTKGEILNTLIDEYYFKNWELADATFRKLFPDRFDSEHILNVLSIVAVISDYSVLFYRPKKQDYSYKDMLVRTKSGITHDCLRNIIALCTGEHGDIRDYLITFYLESGMLVFSAGIYQFTNKVIEDYFSARGILKLCFTKEYIIPFSSESWILSGLKNLFVNREYPTKELVAGLLPEPSHLVNSIYKDYPDWKLHFASRDYISWLGFAAVIIGVRNNEVSMIVKTKVIKQLNDCLDIFNTKANRNIRSRVIRYFSGLKPIYLNRALIETKDKLAFESVFDDFKKNMDIANGTHYWSYFELFPDQQRLRTFCSEILDRKVYLSESKFYRHKRLNYLHKYQPLEMAGFYIKAMAAPDAYKETLFNPKDRHNIYTESISHLWNGLSGDNSKLEDTTRQLSKIVLEQVLKSDNKIVLDLCTDFIQICPDSMKNKLFFKHIFQLVQRTKGIDELKKLLTLLRLCSSIPSSQMQTYNSDFESLYRDGDFETKMFLLDFCCRSTYSSVIDKYDLLPFIAKELPQGLTSSDPDTITLSLCFLQSCSPDVLTSLEINLLPTFLTHEEERVRLHAMNLISKWRLENYVSEVFLFAFFSNEDGVIPITSAIKFLIDMSIQCYYLVLRFNRYEGVILDRVATYQKMHEEFIEVDKAFPKIRSLHDNYRDCIAFFEHCGTPEVIPFLEQLRRFLYSKEMRLDPLIIKTIHNIEMRSRKFELFAKRNPDKMVKLKDEIDKLEGLLGGNT